MKNKRYKLIAEFNKVGFNIRYVKTFKNYDPTLQLINIQLFDSGKTIKDLYVFDYGKRFKDLGILKKNEKIIFNADVIKKNGTILLKNPTQIYKYDPYFNGKLPEDKNIFIGYVMSCLNLENSYTKRYYTWRKSFF